MTSILIWVLRTIYVSIVTFMFPTKWIVVYAFFLIRHPFFSRLSPKIYLKERFYQLPIYGLLINSTLQKSSIFVPQKPLYFFRFLCHDMLHKTGYSTSSHHQWRSYNQFYVKYFLRPNCQRFCSLGRTNAFQLFHFKK